MEAQFIDAVRKAMKLIRQLGDNHPKEKADLIKRLTYLKRAYRNYQDDQMPEQATQVLVAIGRIHDVLVPYRVISLEESSIELRLMQYVQSEDFQLLKALYESKGAFEELWQIVTSDLPEGVVRDWSYYEFVQPSKDNAPTVSRGQQPESPTDFVWELGRPDLSGTSS